MLKDLIIHDYRTALNHSKLICEYFLHERSRNTVLVTSTQVHYLSHRTVQYGAFQLIHTLAARTPVRADQPVEQHIASVVKVVHMSQQ